MTFGVWEIITTKCANGLVNSYTKNILISTTFIYNIKTLKNNKLLTRLRRTRKYQYLLQKIFALGSALKLTLILPALNSKLQREYYAIHAMYSGQVGQVFV